MAGQQSAGFDLVMEYSESPLRDVFGVVFDTSNLLCTLLDGLSIPCEGFNISVSLDRDPMLTPAQIDAVDIQITATLGVAWRIRLIAGVDVDRGTPGLNMARLNLHDRLYHLSVTSGSAPVDTTWLSDYLRNTVRAMPLPLAVSVSTDPNASTLTPTRLDVHVIDATVGENAFAVCLTYGGGTPGRLADLTESAIPAGSTATLMVGFGWLLRLMEPSIEAGIGLAPGDFVDGHLTRSVVIDHDNDVNLTRLDFTLEDGFVRVRSRVEKSGTCYDASADFGGDFRLDVHNGQLRVDADLSDPDLDIDVPWYCWIGAVFLGALLGGIVGAVLAPLLLHLMTSTVEDVVNTVADTIVAAIDAATPSVNVPAVGFNLIFQNAFVDDVGIGCRFVVKDTAPVRCQGVVRLRPGQELDLDNGSVGAVGDIVDGADLRWTGRGAAAKLEALCVTRIADTAGVRFDETLRYRLYGLGYSRQFVPVSQLGHLSVIDLPFVSDIEIFTPSLAVYAVRTNERRIALVQAIDLDDDTVTLRYKTFGVADPTVRILGGFACPPREHGPVVLGGKVKVDSVITRPPVPPRTALPAKLAPLLAAGHTDRSRAAGRPPADLSRLHEMAALEGTLGGTAQAQLRSHDARVSLPASELLELADQRPLAMSDALTRRLAVIGVPRQRTAVFTTTVDSISDIRSVTWWLNRTLLDPTAGQAHIDGVGYTFSQAALTLTLTTDSTSAYEFELRVAVENANADRFTTSRCVSFSPVCPRTFPVVGHWRELVGVVTGVPTTWPAGPRRR